MNFQDYSSACALTDTDVVHNAGIDTSHLLSTSDMSSLSECSPLTKIKDVSNKAYQLTPNFIDTLQPETSNVSTTSRFAVQKLRDALHHYIFAVGNDLNSGVDTSVIIVNDNVFNFTNTWEGIDSIFSEYPYSIGKTKLSKKIRELIVEANNESFSNGIESNLITEIDQLVQIHGSTVLEIIYDYTQNSGENVFSVDVLVEIVQYLGRCENENSEKYRFLLLTRYLKHNSTLVRDAALIGLSYFDTPNVVAVLVAAIKREKIQELKEDMESLLEDFEEENEEGLVSTTERIFWHIY